MQHLIGNLVYPFINIHDRRQDYELAVSVMKNHLEVIIEFIIA